ncbi:MAG: hypothetical protein PHH77_09555 [Victivallaceae bacterium]|nr:hypothetical protein [Victivallaceae bacterium]
MKKILFGLFYTLISGEFLFAAKLENVQVKTGAPENKTVTVWYRVPDGYDPKSKNLYRVLILFGGRNSDGKGVAAGGLGFREWADENKVFLVSPGFRNDDYWYPRDWYGPALLKSLAKIKKNYRICTTKMLFYGYSGGSQCSNLFPAWRPDLCRAWVSHACGVFHEPSRRMAGCPGLVTCGDADLRRYIISSRFVDESRKKGVFILWKSYPNLPHQVPPESLRLARAFLSYYHREYLADLNGRLVSETFKPEKALYVGDDQEGRFWPAGDRMAGKIAPEDRINFPSRELALAWGSEAATEKAK